MKYSKNITFNMEYEPDKEAAKYAKRIPNFSGTMKALLVDFFKNNDMPEERLKLITLEHKLNNGKFAQHSANHMKREIKSLRIKIGIEQPKTQREILQERLEVLKDRIKSGRSKSYEFRCKQEIKEIEQKLNELV